MAGLFRAGILRCGIGLVLALGAPEAWAQPARAQNKVPPPSREAAQYSYAPIVKRSSPAVVNVFARGTVQVQSPFGDDAFFRRFFGDRFGMPTERMQNSLGSGVIVSPDGAIVTNTHVIKLGGATEIRVVLADRREFDAKVLQQDEKTDLAVLKIEGEGRLPFLEFENSDALEVGDMVLAIGNPFGVGQTVTQGIVSALGRTEIAQSNAQVFIQTDAAINPGNSGGALVDMSGRLVGINTAIYSRSGGSHGIGFAIPSNLVKLVVESAVAGRKLERPWLGAKLETVTRDNAEALQLDRAVGAYVTRVYPASPAAQAGLLQGDVILGVDGVEAADARSIMYRLTTRGIGNTAELDVSRVGKRMAVNVTLRAPPKAGKDDVRNLAGDHPLDGARVSNLLPSVADELGLDQESGAVVLSVRKGSIAANLGFKAGDIVASIGSEQIDNVAKLEGLLKQRQKMWRMAVKRGGRTLQIQVPG
jgi:Do/DeqQ family serine protease